MTTRDQELSDPTASVACTINVDERNNSMTTTALTTPPGCPWWCEKPAGHPYDSKPAPGELTRHHQACVIEFAVSRTVFTNGDGRASVAIEAYEAVTDGKLELQPPIVATYFDYLHELDVEDCRRMADALTTARERLLGILAFEGQPIGEDAKSLLAAMGLRPVMVEGLEDHALALWDDGLILLRADICHRDLMDVLEQVQPMSAEERRG